MMQQKPLNILVNNSDNHHVVVPEQPVTEHISSDIPKERQSIKDLIEKVKAYIKERYCTEHQVVGIEIQPDIIRVAEAREINGKWKIEKLVSKNVLNSFNFDSFRKNPKLYSDALIEVFSKNKIQNRNVALAIPASLAITKTISLPLMGKDSLDKATKIPSFWQNLVQISENLSDYSIYYKITKEITAKKEMEVLFVAVKKLDLDIYKQIVLSANLNLVVIDVGCFPIINLSKLKEDKNIANEAILKIGKDENYLEIMEDGKPYIYDIFVPENEKSYLGEYFEHQTFQVRFASQLKHIISKHEDKFKNKIREVNVISSEKNISKLISGLSDKIVEIKIIQTNLFEKLDVDEKLFDGITEDRSAFAITSGLATRKIEIFADESKKQISDAINLLPNAEGIKSDLRAAFYSKVTLGAIVALCSLIVTFYSLFSAGQYSSNYKEISEFNNLSRQYSEKNKLYKELTENGAHLNRLVKFSAEIPANQALIISTLKQVSSNIPDGVWLEKIKIDKNLLIIEGRAFEENNIIEFTKAFEGSDVVENLIITNMKSTPLENGGMIKDFVMNANIIKK